MGSNRAVKAAVGFMSAALLLAIPGSIARANNYVAVEQGVAGIAQSLDNYYGVAQEQAIGTSGNSLLKVLNTDIASPYSNLGVSIADKYVNIRQEPTTDSKVVGKLYRGCAADILERLDGDWVKIKSGKVKGYIASNFLAIGKDAETMVDKYATQYATVKTKTLRVRDKQNTNSKILTLIPQGETYIIVKNRDDWAEILLGNDEDTGKDFTGFVSKDFIKIHVKFKYAISIKEENRIKRRKAAAKRAEIERRKRLAAEKAAIKAEKARRAAEARKAAEAKKHHKHNNSSTAKHYTKPKSTHYVIQPTARGSEIASYARKFVGNRYIWGGESLTSGADCSGFVKAIYRDFGYSLPRTSREQASSAGKRINISNRQPGDLVFYTNSSGTVNHVAMYIGNDLIVQAANSRQGIIISQYNYRSVYCMRRIL